MAEYLMAMLKEAIANAEADRERWSSEGTPTQPVAAADAPAAPSPLGATGFYFVAEYAEDSDGDGLGGDHVHQRPPLQTGEHGGVDQLLVLDIGEDQPAAWAAKRLVRRAGHEVGDADRARIEPRGDESRVVRHVGHEVRVDGIGDGAEDTDGDGDDDFTECMVFSDPLVPDSGALPPLTDGLVLSGEYNIQFTPVPGRQNILGPLLFCNNNITADGLVTTEPSPGLLRLNWNSTFIHYDPFFAPQGGPDNPGQELTDAERAALRDAFGEGTEMDLGRLSLPDQARVDQLPEHVLDYYEKVASEQLRKEFQLIQEVNTGVRQPPPGITLERYMKIRLNQIHTQFTRLTAVGKSLARRFGRAVNRILPFLGGIIILANADTIAADFLSAMQDYSYDIGIADDETGSAAILSGRCNDLAPGSGNIVLNYLLR